MTVLLGGAFAAGAVRVLQPGNWFLTQSPGGDTVASMTPWLRIVPDPLGRPFHVLRAWVAHKNYADVPVRASKSAEVKLKDTYTQWGVTHTYYWRYVIDPEWITWPGEENTIIGQIHEINGPAVTHRPTFEFHISDGELIFMHTMTSQTLGVVVHSRTVVPGQDIEVFVRAHWADGSHVPDAQGLLELFVDGALVWSSYGQRNTWDPNPDDNAPYLVAGVYVPEQLSWWTGRDRTTYLVGMVVGDAAETNESMRAHVIGQLR